MIKIKWGEYNQGANPKVEQLKVTSLRVQPSCKHSNRLTKACQEQTLQLIKAIVSYEENKVV